MNMLDANILLAEDEASLQYVFERQMKALGYGAPDLADNGFLAVEKALQKRYHLIFMDIRMPELDGVQAAERIRQAENKVGFHTPIVGLTAFALKQRCLDAGMDDFLQKPVTLQQLGEVLNKWLKAVPTDTRSILLEVVQEPFEESKFRKTEDQFKNIQHRIDNLRKRVGLE